ncbi:MAG: hypothetical protein QHJ73_19130, partial [Armatimonadota bacterium]|nr:hypothetical protein [Armatimonadota bacterium]
MTEKTAPPPGHPSSSAVERGRVHRHALLFFIVLLTCLPALGYVWVSGPLHDDQDTPFLLRGIDQTGGLAGSWRWFFRDWPLQSHLYRPVTLISIALDRALWGDWAPGYRLTAWFLALLVSGMTAWLALAVTGSYFAAATAAVLLAFERLGYNPASIITVRAHAPSVVIAGAVLWMVAGRLRRAGNQRAARVWEAPALAVPVALVALYAERVPLPTITTWIAARTAHLGTLFGTLTLVLLWRYMGTGRGRWLGGALMACALGLDSYEQVVVLPPLV